MSDQSLLKIGQIIETEQFRDAIHVAVVPVISDGTLLPGARVGLDAFGRATTSVKPIGVVDPFLNDLVKPGEQFWLFLKPGSITSLRHSWSHPAFDSQPEPPNEKSAAEQWLRTWLEASGEDVTYNLLINVCDNGRQYTAQGHDLHLQITDEAWEKIEIVTGRKYDKPHREETYFSCSC